MSMTRLRSISFLLHGTRTITSNNFNQLNARRFCSSNGTLLARYKSMVKTGNLQHDPYQLKLASQLDNLLSRLQRYDNDMENYLIKLQEWEKKREEMRRKLLMEEAEKKQQEDAFASPNKQRGRLFERWALFGRKPKDVEPEAGRWVSFYKREKKLDSLVGPRPTAPPAPKGLYIYGNVGSGKTMLMDMFYCATEGLVKHRRRLHFHEAMLNINEQMHQIWKNQMEEKSSQSSISSWIMNLPMDMKVKEWLAGEERYNQEAQMKNILLAVADKFLVDQQVGKAGASILCFDEIQTVDVFAIVALSGILSRLLANGTVLVATSNRAPTHLNQDGMQKEIFQTLVAKLDCHCEIFLIGSEIDYRRYIAQRSEDKVHFFWPLESKVLKEFEEAWNGVTSQLGGQITSATIPVMFGRKLEVPESCNGAAKFTFEYLCGRPLGAADYIAVAKNYHTVFISDVPIMSMENRDKARRFITLIDELYNHHCCLFCSSASSIDDLFQGSEDGPLLDLESFQFETEAEGGKLRRDVLAEGNVGSGGAPSGIVSMLSGREEMFAFKRAVSRLIEMQTATYLEGIETLHPYFMRKQKQIECTDSSILQSQASSGTVHYYTYSST